MLQDNLDEIGPLNPEDVKQEHIDAAYKQLKVLADGVANDFWGVIKNFGINQRRARKLESDYPAKTQDDLVNKEGLYREISGLDTILEAPAIMISSLQEYIEYAETVLIARERAENPTED